MLQTAIVIFRECIEAFLILAVMSDYLIKTDRKHFLKPLFIGAAVAAGASLLFADVIDGMGKSELAEGILSMIAGALVLSLTFYVVKTARFYKQHVQNIVNKADEKQGFWKYFAIALFAFVMIGREGTEITLLLFSISYEADRMSMYIGSIVGLIGATTLCFLWLRYSHLINLGKFLRATSIFLALFAIHMFIYGFHELTEAYVLPIDNDYWHVATEGFADPESLFSKISLYGITAIPFLYLAYYGLLSRRQVRA